MTHHIRHDPGGEAARMECVAFERLLADYLEGDLRPAVCAAADRHRSDCAACAALVADLDDLRERAERLPEPQPSRDLWAGIEARIAAPVVMIGTAGPRADTRPADRRGHMGARYVRGSWAAAAAALLVAGLGAAGYVVTRAADDRVPTVATTPPAVAPVRITAPRAVPARDDAAEAPRLVTGAEGPEVGGRSTQVPAAPAVSPYDADLAALRRTLDARRASLDTGTVRVLETNLAILDGAIRESRAALVREPASQLLHQQLNNALGSKLELMRTAVLLSGDD